MTDFFDFEDSSLDRMFRQIVKTSKPKRVAFYRPEHKYFNVSVLAPEGFEWTPGIYNDYPESTYSLHHWQDLTTDSHITIVHHGHPVGVFCRNDYFCHVSSWRPVGDEPVKFLQELYVIFPKFKPPDVELEVVGFD